MYSWYERSKMCGMYRKEVKCIVKEEEMNIIGSYAPTNDVKVR